MGSRRLEDLQPRVQNAARDHILKCADQGIELLVYCTLRDAREQARLYWQGRTADQVQRKIDALTNKGFPDLAVLLEDTGPQEGRKVTFAGPGESFHQYGLAYDCVPLVGGKAEWRTSGEAADLWQIVGESGKSCGLEWAGDWTRFREFPHFQRTGGRSLEDLMKEHFGGAEATPPAPVAAALAAASREGAVLRQALAEPNTVFMVFASGAGASDDRIEATLDLARRVASSLSPDVWRTFWVHRPDELDADLAQLLWEGSDPHPAVVLSLGTGLDRRVVGSHDLPDLHDALAVSNAFSQG